jgi:hypothetical protein
MLINAYRLNHDKKVWGDPEAFRPERFLDENMELIKDSNNKLLSFGAGRWRLNALLMHRTYIRVRMRDLTFLGEPLF